MGPLINVLNRSDFSYVYIAIFPSEHNQEGARHGGFCTNISIYSSRAILRNWNLCDHWLQPTHNFVYISVYGESQSFLTERWSSGKPSSMNVFRQQLVSTDMDCWYGFPSS